MVYLGKLPQWRTLAIDTQLLMPVAILDRANRKSDTMYTF